ncbi:MAG: class I SAM-dependent methyltransferase [Planctomycetota bacterium]
MATHTAQPPTAPDPSSQPGLYDDPVVYDILHAPGTALEVNGLERLAIEQLDTGPRTQTWLEPACGTARHLRLAAKRGYHAAGFDRSPTMIEDATRRARRAGIADRCRFFVADMTDFEIAPRSVDLALNLINTIRHLATDDDLLAHLDLVADALRPAGAYAVGLSTTAYGLEPPSEDVWTTARGSRRITQVVQYEPPAEGDRNERVVSHVTSTTPSHEAHATSTYWLRTYSLDQWLDALDRSALAPAGTFDESGRPIPPAEIGYRVWLLTLR